VFTLGGSLLFGASWSIESGNGLSEQCVFVTTEGEVAVYSGSDPASASTWTKTGVYRIGKPRGPKALVRAGGDLVIATDIGFIPLSVATQRDIAALSPSAISYPIETGGMMRSRSELQATGIAQVWPTKQMVIVAPPTGSRATAADARCECARPAHGVCSRAGCNLHGAVRGSVLLWLKGRRCREMEVTGADQGVPFTATVVPLFDPLEKPGIAENRA
jgi:hypothetical protein